MAALCYGGPEPSAAAAAAIYQFYLRLPPTGLSGAGLSGTGDGAVAAS